MSHMPNIFLSILGILFIIVSYIQLVLGDKIQVLGRYNDVNYQTPFEITFPFNVQSVHGNDKMIIGNSFSNNLFGHGLSRNGIFLSTDNSMDGTNTFPSPLAFDKFVANQDLSLGVTKQGKLIAGGSDTNILTGTYSSGTFVNSGDIDEDTIIVNIAISSEHAAVIDVDGKLYTSGSGEGLCGGPTNSRNEFRLASSVPYNSNRKFHFLSISSKITLVIDSLGLAHGCGRYIGNGNDEIKRYLSPVTHLYDRFNVIQVAASEKNSYFLLNNGSVFSSGVKEDLKLGYESVEDVLFISKPLEIGNDGEMVVMISAMKESAVALTYNGKVFFWGKNLAIFSTQSPPTPLDQIKLSGYISTTDTALISIPISNLNLCNYGQRFNGNQCIDCENGKSCTTVIYQENCPFGTWSKNSLTVCTKLDCPHGKVCKLGKLFDCPPGKYCIDGKIEKCLGEYYNSDSGKSSCEICSSNSYTMETVNGEGNTDCHTCPEGLECNGGSTFNLTCSTYFNQGLYYVFNSNLFQGTTEVKSGTIQVLSISSLTIVTSTNLFIEDQSFTLSQLISGVSDNILSSFSGETNILISTINEWVVCDIQNSDTKICTKLDTFSVTHGSYLGDASNEYAFIYDGSSSIIKYSFIIGTSSIITIPTFVTNTKILSIFYNPNIQGLLIITKEYIYNLHLLEDDIFEEIYEFDSTMKDNSLFAFDPISKLLYIKQDKSFTYLNIEFQIVTVLNSIPDATNSIFFNWKSKNCGSNSYCDSNGGACINFIPENWCSFGGCGSHGICPPTSYTSNQFSQCVCDNNYLGDFCELKDCSIYGGSPQQHHITVIGSSSLKETSVLGEYIYSHAINITGSSKGTIIFNGAVMADKFLFRWEQYDILTLYRYSFTDEGIFKEYYFSQEGQEPFDVLSISYSNGNIYSSVMAGYGTKLYYYQSIPENNFRVERFYIADISNIADARVCGNRMGILFANAEQGYKYNFIYTLLNQISLSTPIEADSYNQIVCSNDDFILMGGSKFKKIEFNGFGQLTIKNPVKLYGLFGNSFDLESPFVRSDSDLLHYIDGSGIIYSMSNSGFSSGLKSHVGFVGTLGIRVLESTFCSSNGACDILSDDSVYCQCYNNWEETNKIFDAINCSFIECNTGYYGEDCNNWTCYGYNKDDTISVCGGHGFCPFYNQCICFENWHGVDCTVAQCYSIVADSPDACTNRCQGKCLDLDNCTCSDGFEGYFCDIPICEGGCGSGTCITPPGFNPILNQCPTPNICQCPPGKAGNNCQFNICFDKFEIGVVCSGSGTCNEDNICECDPGYIGEQCQYWYCNSIPNNDSYVCSGHGNCTELNICSCENNYGGEYCQDYKCNGIYQYDVSVCNGHGDCIAQDKCSCNEGFYGEYCDNWFCNGIPKGEGACNNKGDCLDTLICDCHPGYLGDYCDFYSCYGISSKDLNVCSGHGTCTNVNNCECQSDDYTGGNCEKYYCNNTLVNNEGVCNDHGACIGHDDCRCDEEWDGQFCESQVCYGKYLKGVVCSGHGDCVNYNDCECMEGYSGYECQFQTCFGLNSSEPTVCSGNGNCVLYNVCSCDDGFSRYDCFDFPCFFVPHRDLSVCSSHGSCLTKDNCTCEENYAGNNCQYSICYGQFLPGEVCNGHGYCASLDNCVCDYGYSSNNCSIPTCFGLPSTSENVCNSKGACLGPNNCSCNGSFLNNDCSGPLCAGEDNPLLQCGGINNGICNDHGECECFDGYIGVDCKTRSRFLLSITSEDYIYSNIELLHSISFAIPENKFKIFGQSFSHFKVSTRGVLSFGDYPVNFSSLPVDPYEFTNITNLENHLIFFGYTKTDLSQSVQGQLTWNQFAFRELTSEDKLNISSFIQTEFFQHEELSTFVPSWGFVFTMNHIGYYSKKVDLLNDAQLIIASDDSQLSIVIMNFPLDGIKHPQINPKIGFSTTTSHLDLMDLIDPVDRKSSLVKSSTNVLTPGVYTFIVSSAQIQQQFEMTCFSITFNHSEVCSGHGKCIGYDQCLCNDYFGGSQCEISCESGSDWSGVRCNKPRCYGLSWDDPNVCHGRGFCVGPNNCSCIDNYKNNDCSDNICNSVQSSDSHVCGSHGKCIAFDVCECQDGYGKDLNGDCTVPLCFGIPASDPKSCPNDGICVEPNYCTNCSPYLSPTCNTAILYVSLDGDDTNNYCMDSNMPCKTIGRAFTNLGKDSIIILMGGTHILPNAPTYIESSFTIMGQNNAKIITGSDHSYSTYILVLNLWPDVKITFKDLIFENIGSRSILRTYYASRFSLVLENVVINSGYSILSYFGDGTINITLTNVKFSSSLSHLFNINSDKLQMDSLIQVNNLKISNSQFIPFYIESIHTIQMNDVIIDNCNIETCLFDAYSFISTKLTQIELYNSSTINSALLMISNGESFNLDGLKVNNVSVRGKGLMTVANIINIEYSSFNISHVISQLDGIVSNFESSKKVEIHDIFVENSICSSNGAFYFNSIDHLIVYNSSANNVTAKSGSFLYGISVKNISIYDISTYKANGLAIPDYLSGEGTSLWFYGSGALHIRDSNFSQGHTLLYAQGDYFIQFEYNNVFNHQYGSVQIIENNANMINIKNSMFLNNNNLNGFGGSLSILQCQGMVTIYHCNFDNSSSVNGGSVFTIEIGRLFITNSTFENCIAQDEGGAFYAEDIGILEVYNSEFKNNKAVFGGGLILKKIVKSLYFLKYGGSFFQDVVIENNYAEQGGGIYLAIENIFQLNSGAFIENHALKSGGAFLAEGQTYANSLDISESLTSGVSFSDTLFSKPQPGLIINDTTFQSNSANENGGALSCFGSSVLMETNRCLYINNSAQSSGGSIFLFVDYAELFSTIIQESSSLFGSAIFVFMSMVKNGVLFDDLVITDSFSKGEGVIYLSPNVKLNLRNGLLQSNKAQRGIIYLDDSEVEFNNTQFIENAVETEGGVFYLSDSSRVKCETCEFIGNTANLGGVAYFGSYKFFYLSNIISQNNNASYGGTFYFNDKSERATPSNFYISHANFSDYASIAGGSIYTSISNPNVTNYWDSLENCTLNSFAGIYGDNFATNPMFINITNIIAATANLTTKSITIYPGQSFDVDARVFDTYNQEVTFFPGLTLAISSNFTLFGTLQQSIINSYASFQDIALYGKKRTSNLITIVSEGLDIPLKSDYFTATLIDCPLGFRYSFGDLYDSCVRCTKGSYAIIPAATECYFNCIGFKCHGGYTITFDRGYWIQARKDGSLRALPCLNGHCVGGTFEFMESGIPLPFISENDLLFIDTQDLTKPISSDSTSIQLSLFSSFIPSISSSNIITSELSSLQDTKSENELTSLPISNSIQELTGFLGILENGTLISGHYYIGSNCQANRQGILCAECLPGFEEFKGRCVPCEGPNIFLIFFHLCHLMIMVIYIHITSQSEKGSASTRILISFMQTSLLTVDFNRWTAKHDFESLGILGELVKSFFSFQLPSFGDSSESNSSGGGLLEGCPFPRPGYWLFGYDLLNFFLYFVVLVIAAIFGICCCWPMKLFSKPKKRVNSSFEDGGLVSFQDWDSEVPVTTLSPPQKIAAKIYKFFAPSAFVRSFLSTFIFSFQPLTSLTMTYLLSCFSLVGGEYVMINNTNLQCWTNGSYWLWSLIFIPVLILILFGPTFSAIILFINKKRLHNSGFKHYFGILYEIYKPEYFWFEWVFTTKKTFLIISTIVSQMLTISYGVDGLQFIFYAFVIVFTYIFILRYNPYRSPGDNAMEKVSLLISLLIIGVQEGTSIYTESVGMILGISLILICLFAIILHVIFENAFVKKIIRRIKSIFFREDSNDETIISKIVVNEFPQARRAMSPKFDFNQDTIARKIYPSVQMIHTPIFHASDESSSENTRNTKNTSNSSRSSSSSSSTSTSRSSSRISNAEPVPYWNENPFQKDLKHNNNSNSRKKNPSNFGSTMAIQFENANQFYDSIPNEDDQNVSSVSSIPFLMDNPDDNNSINSKSVHEDSSSMVSKQDLNDEFQNKDELTINDEPHISFEDHTSIGNASFIESQIGSFSSNSTRRTKKF